MNFNDPTHDLSGAPEIDSIEFIELLGKGGMSLVYKARQKEMDRIVAVKVLARTAIRGDEGIKRFHKEAKLTSSLDHPNIVKTISFGVSNDGQPYLVMEYLEGRSLAEELKKCGRFELRKFRDVFLPALSALDQAHRAGLIHRDIKPANIMLVNNPSGEDTVKLVDFGIAKALATEENEADKLTITGAMLGTPMYMSPEQCRGKSVDIRSDLYSMACVMYETLSGEPPFRGESPLVVMQKHSNMDPPTVSEWSRRIDIRRELAKVTLWGLAKEPSLRPQSASAFAKKLNEVLERITLDKIPRLRPEIELSDFSKLARNKFVIASTVVVTMIAVFWLGRMSNEVVVPEKQQSLTKLVAQAGNYYAKHDRYRCLSSLTSYLAASRESGNSKLKQKTLTNALSILKSLRSDNGNEGDLLRVFELENAAVQEVAKSNLQAEIKLHFYFNSLLNAFDKTHLSAMPKPEFLALLHLTESYLQNMEVKITPSQETLLQLMNELCSGKFQEDKVAAQFARIVLAKSPTWTSRYQFARQINNIYPDESLKLFREVIQDKEADLDKICASYFEISAILLNKHEYARALESTNAGLALGDRGHFAIENTCNKITALYHLKRNQEMRNASQKLLELIAEAAAIDNNMGGKLSLDGFVCLLATNQNDRAKEILLAMLAKREVGALTFSESQGPRILALYQTTKDPVLKSLISMIIQRN